MKNRITWFLLIILHLALTLNPFLASASEDSNDDTTYDDPCDPRGVDRELMLLFYGRTFCLGCSDHEQDRPELDFNREELNRLGFTAVREKMALSQGFSHWLSGDDWICDEFLVAEASGYEMVDPGAYGALKAQADTVKAKWDAENTNKRKIMEIHASLDNLGIYIRRPLAYFQQDLDRVFKDYHDVAPALHLNNGKTPLMTAAYTGNLPAVRYLVETLGVNILAENYVDSLGRSMRASDEAELAARIAAKKEACTDILKYLHLREYAAEMNKNLAELSTDLMVLKILSEEHRMNLIDRHSGENKAIAHGHVKSRHLEFIDVIFDSEGEEVRASLKQWKKLDVALEKLELKKYELSKSHHLHPDKRIDDLLYMKVAMEKYLDKQLAEKENEKEREAIKRCFEIQFLQIDTQINDLIIYNRLEGSQLETEWPDEADLDRQIATFSEQAQAAEADYATRLESLRARIDI